ncbi:MAG: hemerythrin domain-containing protein [Magnetospirillum sp.]|nr:hemerythrin domain-containing protein [Magnetospirillum sp.]
MISDTAIDIPGHPLPWLDSFEVGNERIDGEHRALMDAANDLCALALHQTDPRVLRGAGRELIAIVEAHFTSEESLFPAIGYTGMLSHVREHLSIMESLNSLLLADNHLDAPMAAGTARLLLLEHIIRHDLGFKTWIQVAKGQ